MDRERIEALSALVFDYVWRLLDEELDCAGDVVGRVASDAEIAVHTRLTKYYLDSEDKA